MPEGPEEALRPIRELVRDCPEGWAMVAEVVRRQQPEEMRVFLEFLAGGMGAEALPLLRLLASGPDDAPALEALRALPLVGSPEAVAVLRETLAVHPSGERGALARAGLDRLEQAPPGEPHGPEDSRSR